MVVKIRNFSISTRDFLESYGLTNSLDRIGSQNLSLSELKLLFLIKTRQGINTLIGWCLIAQAWPSYTSANLKTWT